MAWSGAHNNHIEMCDTSWTFQGRSPIDLKFETAWQQVYWHKAKNDVESKHVVFCDSENRITPQGLLSKLGLRSLHRYDHDWCSDWSKDAQDWAVWWKVPTNWDGAPELRALVWLLQWFKHIHLSGVWLGLIQQLSVIFMFSLLLTCMQLFKGMRHN